MKAVIPAAGRGTRMQGAGVGGPDRLYGPQKREADAGRKAMIPFHGHPFLSYGLHELAEGGVTEVCLVVAPDQAAPMEEWIDALAPRRLRIDLAVQETPDGSARAVEAARGFVNGDPFLVVNGDNLYPAVVVEAVRHLPGHGLAGFSQAGLVGGTITRERLSAFALVARDEGGHLRAIVEKPAPEARRRMGLGDDALVSMTCWRFEPEIFEVIAELEPSVRGEYEIPAAVMRLVRERNRDVRVMPVDARVLDLTHRRDIPVVEELLRGRTVRL